MAIYKRSYTLTLALVLLQTLGFTRGYSRGAPAALCETMIPGHGVDGPRDAFEIVLDKTSVMGADTLHFNLSARGDKFFKGFLVRVRKSEKDDKAYGTFTNLPAKAKPLACFEVPNSGVTHADGTKVRSVALEWVAPNDADGDYEILATFVEDHESRVPKLVHPQKIRVTRNVNIAAPTAAPVRVLEDEMLRLANSMYENCGKSKGCFGIPDGCVQRYMDAQNPTVQDLCTMMTTWEKSGEENKFQLTGRLTDANIGYVAVGITKQKGMPYASVVGCLTNQQRILRSHNPGYSNEPHRDNPSLGIVSPTVAVHDGHMFCTFSQINHEIHSHSYDFNDEFYFMMSRAEGGEFGLGKHGPTDKIVTTRALHITTNEIVSASDSPILIQLHGSFMIIAWLICASTGMFTARYLKQTHTELMPFNKAFWFVIHISCMFSAFFLTVCGIIFIFVKKGGYSKGLTGSAQWHPILGLILTGLAVCQVCIAFFRPHPNTRWRPLFNWVHWSIGNSAHIVGIACIFLADTLSISGIQDHPTYKWVLTGFVCFHVLIHLIMSIHTLWADKQMNTKNKMRAARPGPMKPSGVSDEAPGTGLRTFLLLLYIAGVVGTSITLIYFVAKGHEETNESTA